MGNDGDGAAPVMNSRLRHGSQVWRQTRTVFASAGDQVPNDGQARLACLELRSRGVDETLRPVVR